MRVISKAVLAMTAAAGLALCAAPASAATMISAQWGDGCSKTTCFNEKGVYTHTWSALDVSGPVTIGKLSLDRNILGDLDTKMFKLSFQIDGQEVGSWGTFLMSAIGGDILTFGGEAFDWNPEWGDLTLVLELIPPPKEGFGFASFSPSDDGDGGGGGGGSFVQSFDFQPDDNGDGDPQQPDSQRLTGAVPEPTTWALMITGFGGAGAMLRRRRTVLASA